MGASPCGHYKLLTFLDSWDDPTAAGWRFSRLFDKSWKIFGYKCPSLIGENSRFSSKTILLQAGRHEWPFEIEIHGSTKESIDGLCNSHVSYDLKATISKGRLGSSLRVRKPVRIIRAFSLTTLSPTGPLREEGIWPEKIEYQFCIPQRAIAFGTGLAIYMRVVSLLMGLKIARINCALEEFQTLRMPGTHPGTGFKRLRTVAQWKFDSDCLGEYTLQEVLPLPNQFTMCVQDTDVFEIQVRHEIQIRLDLENPDGHISE